MIVSRASENTVGVVRQIPCCFAQVLCYRMGSWRYLTGTSQAGRIGLVNISRRDLLSGVATSVVTHAPRKSVLNTVAFDYAAKLPGPDLAFLAKFDVVVTGGVLPVDQLLRLQSAKARLVLYQWSSALYLGDGGPAQKDWQDAVQRNARSWLLAPKSVAGGAASPGRSALWYDFGNLDLVSALAEHIHMLLAAHGYRGVFLDTLGHSSLPPELLREYDKRHPSLEYDRAQAGFISKCREALGPQGIIFTNQGYRRAEIFLPHADFDLIENSTTLIEANGDTRFRPLYDARAPWESVQVPMTNLIIPAAQAFPQTQFVHLNYASGNDRTCARAVRYSYACAKLWNQTSYVAPPHIQKVIRENIYFTRVGDPLTASQEEDREAGVAWRRFSNGVVAVNSSENAYRIGSLSLNLPDPPQGYVFLKQKHLR